MNIEALIYVHKNFKPLYYLPFNVNLKLTYFNSGHRFAPKVISTKHFEVTEDNSSTSYPYFRNYLVDVDSIHE